MKQEINSCMLDNNPVQDTFFSGEKGIATGCQGGFGTKGDMGGCFIGNETKTFSNDLPALSEKEKVSEGVLQKSFPVTGKTDRFILALVFIIRMISTFMERVVLYFGLFLCILGICFASYASMGTLSFEETYKDGLYALFLDINNALPSFCLIIVLLERISAHPFYRLSYPDEYIRTFLIRFIGWFAYDCILILLIYRYVNGLSATPFYAGGPYAEFHYPGTISLLIAFKLMSIAIKNVPHSIIRIYSYYRRIKASRADMDTYIRGILK